MVIESILYALGTYFIAKSLLVLIFKKPLIGFASKLIKKKKSVNALIILEIILGLALIAVGYFFF
jgi:hypothetical protein